MRLFLAVHLSEEMKTRAIQIIEVLKTAKADVNWIDKEALHITLKFLGDTDKSRVKGIIPLLADIGKNGKTFEISTGKQGAFPNVIRPKILFTDISNGKDEIITLSKMIDETLITAAFKREEKPFNPHITLGRCRSVVNLEKLSECLLNTNFPHLGQKVESFFLVKSELVGNRAVYKDISEFKFGKS